MQKYKFLIFSRSTNHILLLSDPDKNAPLYIGKISKPVNGFADLDNRHSMAQKFGKLLGIPIPEFNNCSSKNIVNIGELYEKMPSFKYLTEILICDYRGPRIDQFLNAVNLDIDRIKNVKIIWESIAFNLWIGNHDRKLADYVIDGENAWFIDYDLSGIGFENPGLFEHSVGFCAEAFDFYAPDIKFCIDCQPGFLFSKFLENPKEVRFNLVKPMIDKIKNLKNEQIKNIVKSVDIFRRNSDNKIKINDEYFAVLLKRRECLEEVIRRAFDFLP